MKTPAQLLSSSSVRYQKAKSRTLEFWSVDGQCKNCSYHADIKQLIKQQISISGVVLIPRASEVMKL